mmetsp:Transcript_19261/g.42936  ORF Transcript_19261/g.42936 Transcript_19261/m.42936 type:complete len:307 (+) Transcript_19261:291-1211(+)
MLSMFAPTPTGLSSCLACVSNDVICCWSSSTLSSLPCLTASTSRFFKRARIVASSRVVGRGLRVSFIFGKEALSSSGEKECFPSSRSLRTSISASHRNASAIAKKALFVFTSRANPERVSTVLLPSWASVFVPGSVFPLFMSSTGSRLASGRARPHLPPTASTSTATGDSSSLLPLLAVVLVSFSERFCEPASSAWKVVFTLALSSPELPSTSSISTNFNSYFCFASPLNCDMSASLARYVSTSMPCSSCSKVTASDVSTSSRSSPSLMGSSGITNTFTQRSDTVPCRKTQKPSSDTLIARTCTSS